MYLRCPPGVRMGVIKPWRSILFSVNRLMRKYSAASRAFNTTFLSAVATRIPPEVTVHSDAGVKPGDFARNALKSYQR